MYLRKFREHDTTMLLGIDIGGTNTVFGIVNDSGQIIAKSSISTIGYDNIGSYLDALYEEFKSICPTEVDITGVGIGAPCSNMISGCIENATDLPWSGVIPMAKMVSKRFGVPAVITNDANAAAAGERKFGAAQNYDNFIMITLGTGVGSGIICDGRLLSGSRGFAGELGHVTLGEGYDRDCSCGRKGCLQMYSCGRGIVMTAIEMLAASNEPSVLREFKPEVLTAADVMKAAQEGDKIANDVYQFTGRVLGEAVSNFLAFTDPDAIILFGGVAKADSLIIEPMRKAMNENALFLYRDRVKILKSTLPDADAAIIGAAALAKN